MTMDELLKEQDRLETRLEWLNIHSQPREECLAELVRVELEIAKKGAQSA